MLTLRVTPHACCAGPRRPGPISSPVLTQALSRAASQRRSPAAEAWAEADGVDVVRPVIFAHKPAPCRSRSRVRDDGARCRWLSPGRPNPALSDGRGRPLRSAVHTSGRWGARIRVMDTVLPRCLSPGGSAPACVAAAGVRRRRGDVGGQTRAVAEVTADDGTRRQWE